MAGRASRVETGAMQKRDGFGHHRDMGRGRGDAVRRGDSIERYGFGETCSSDAKAVAGADAVVMNPLTSGWCHFEGEARCMPHCRTAMWP